jgi:hypothetical protein
MVQYITLGQELGCNQVQAQMQRMSMMIMNIVLLLGPC